jgi:PAS domain S-box-containing protein
MPFLGFLLLLLAHGVALHFRVQPAVSLWFPPSGVAIALTLWMGPLGAVLTGLVSVIMAPMWGSSGWMRLIGVMDIVEPLVAWLLYRQLFHGSLTLNNLRSVIVFLLSAPLAACFASAVIGCATLFGLGRISSDYIFETVSHWWVGNAIGTIVIVPIALLVFTRWLARWGWIAPLSSSESTQYDTFVPLDPNRWIELVAILLSTSLIAFVTVQSTYTSIYVTLQFALLGFIPVIWAACRFGVLGGVIVADLTVMLTLIAYLLFYPNAIALSPFPVNPELLHLHKLSLLLQGAMALIVGTATTEWAAGQVALAVEQVRLKEYQATAQLSEKLFQLNRLLTDSNQQLQASEERFRTSVENMLDCFAVMSSIRDEHGTIVDFRFDYLNDAACSNNRLPREAQIGRPLSEILPAHQGSELFREYCEVVETGRSLVRDELVYGDLYGQQSLVRAFDIRASKFGDGFVVTWRDVTSRVLAHDELDRRRQEFTALVENSSDIISRFDRNLRHLYINPSVQAVTGMPPTAFLGRTVSESGMPEEKRRVWEPALQGVLESGHSQSIEFGYDAPDGSRRYFQTRLIPERAIDGDVHSILAVSRDITTLKQTEFQLRERQHFIERITNTVPGIVYVYDLIEQRNVYANLQLAETLGYAAAEVQDMGDQFFPQLMHPEDFARLSQQMTKIAALADGETLEFEFRMRHANGEWRWLSDRATVFTRTPEGHPHQMLGCAQDITARKQIELALSEANQQFQLAAAAVDGMIYDWDLIRDHVIRTEGMTGMLGYPVAGTDPSSQWWWNLIHPDDQRRLNQDVASIPADQTRYTLEYRVRHQQGHYVYVRDQGLILRDERGQMTRMIGNTINISDLKWAEVSLSQANERFQLAASAINSLIYDWNVDPDWVERTEGLVNVLGYAPAEVEPTNQWWRNQVHPTDREKLPSHPETMALAHDRYTQEYRIRHKNGYYVTVQDSGLVLRDDTGQVCRIVGNVIDISDRKQSENALRESEERLRLALKAADQGLYDLNLQTGAAIVSPEYARMLGYDPDTFEETNLRWRDRLHPDDIGSTYQAYEDYVSGNRPDYQVEFRQRTQSGDWKWILSVGKIVEWDEAGQPLRMLGIHTDITNRKESEEALKRSQDRLNLALEAAGMGIWKWTIPANEVLWSAKLEEMFGLSPGTFSGHFQTFITRIHPEDRDLVMQTATEAIRTGNDFTVEFRVVQSDGRICWLVARGKVFHDAGGSPLQMTGVTLDITDRKRIEVERANILEREQAARQQAEAASRMKDEFLAIVSHELRSPLNAILGWARLLRTRKMNPEKVEQALATIERNAQAQTQLIEDLLDISRIIRGAIRIYPRPVNLMTVLQAAIDTTRPAAETKSIQLKTEFETTVGMVSGDPERLQQVVWNLLSNAVKFTPAEGQVTVRLTQVAAKALPAAQPHAQIQVMDTGKGISAEFLPHVFDRFSQADSTTTRNESGLGLGLAIVRNLVELHGGKVYVESPGVGQGSTFIVELPLLPDSYPTQHPVLPYEAVSLANDLLEGLTVLVVDDEADTRDFLAAALEQCGAQVTTAASAQDALTLLPRLRPDVLLSDIGMPEEDGYGLIQKVRALSPEAGGQTPAAALTAYVRGEDRNRAIAAGFQLHVPKPIDPVQLLSVVKQLANRQSH